MKRRIAIVALAVVLAAAGTGAVYAYVHKADQRALADTKAAQVLIADRAIPAGTKWSDVVAGGYVHTDRVPKSTVPQDALNSIAAPIGRSEVTGSDVGAGQVVLRQMFGDRKSATGALNIPSGQIAVSVDIPSYADVAGFVEPNSEVAIFGTYKLAGKKSTNGTTSSPDAMGGQNNDVGLYSTKLLLPRVTVLATSIQAPSDVTGASSIGDTTSSNTSTVNVTLALPQKDAERLILSQTVGQLYLGLLSSDSVTAPDDGVINVAKFSPAPIFVK
jgi:pilus assembly protein CpaB